MTTTIHPRPAVRLLRKARLILWGKAKSGKTLTALKLARGLVGSDGSICVLDTEYEASTLYADRETFDLVPIAPPATRPAWRPWCCQSPRTMTR
jgi:hypothetical protein